MQLEHKRFVFDVETVSDEGKVAGYASLFGVLDTVDDIVMPNAFNDSVAARNGKPLPMLWNHLESFPIGKWTKVEEDQKGLRVEGEVTRGIQKGEETLLSLKHGSIEGLSIGYRTIESKTDDTTGIRRLNRLDLWEVSIVTFPALPVATIDMVKAGPKPVLDEIRAMSPREIETLLTMPSAGLSRSAARLLMKGGLSALQAKQDAGEGKAVHRMAQAILSELRTIGSGP